MFNSFLKHIKQLVDADSSRFLLTVSGGVDSVVLFDLFKKSGLDFMVAHCNFNLRGKESDGDQDFVESLAKNSGVDVVVKSFIYDDSSQSEPESTQMWARRVRYQWFSELKKELKCDYIVTAHHSDDNIETVLLNMARGTGVSGLSGISNLNNDLLRPLLNFKKEEMKSYALREGLTWREDSSNASLKYKRNKVRHELVEQFETLNPNFRNTFSENIEKWIWLKELVFIELEKFKTKHKTDTGFKIPLSSFKDEATKYIVFELLKGLGLTFDQVKAIGDSIHSGKVWKTDLVNILRDREYVFLMFDEKEVLEDRVIETLGRFSFGSEEFLFEKAHTPKSWDLPINETYINAEIIKFPLRIRAWKQGDSFHPLGMTGKKKLSDFMIDQKIPLNLKDKVKVLVTEDEEIIWVINHRLDNRFRLNPNTQEVIKVSCFIKPQL